MIDKETAIRIIRNNFENPFDKSQFINFSKNLVNYLDTSGNFSYQGNYIPDAYKPYIQALERIGQYKDSDSKTIEVLIVQLKKETSLERARTMQRNFIAWYLDGSRGGELKDAALVAVISPDNEDWRFSLVKMEYNLGLSEKTGRLKTEKFLTPARRYSFLVGLNESSHTAQIQLLSILQDDKNNPTLTELENAFSIEVVTKKFFEKYRELFHKVEESLQKAVNQDKKIKDDFETKDVNTVNFSKKLLGQIVFLYFLQKKGWLGVPENEGWDNGDKRFLRTLFSDCQQNKSSYFNDYLEHLFYDALNNQNRGGIDPSYYSRFGCRIPFLNGGLFDPINNYDWMHTDIRLPNELFSNNEITKEGDTGTGILDIFDRYNFTVKEDEPLDKEVAVDPEMLGQVFENLLEVKDRKSKGTYYTPREIVHYMCQESLINYLDTAINTGDVPLVKTPPPQGKIFGEPDPRQEALKTLGYSLMVPREDIETFIHSGDLVTENDARVENNGKETERYSYKLPASIRQHAALIDDKLAFVRVCDPAVGSGAFPVGLMTEIVRARNTLTIYLTNEAGRSLYNFKRHAIQNCLYGVDIDPGAVEIAKLRLWLSLVVDEEDIKQIRPLPNLDYKIVCGNSLSGVRRIENWPLCEQLEKIKPKYFSETNSRKKQEYKDEIDTLINQITDGNRNFDFSAYFSEVFHDRDGFDIVIANPPYDVINDSALREIYKETIYGRANLYGLFIHKSIKDILRKQGVLAFINPKTLLADSYFINLRKYLRISGDFVDILKIEDRHNIFEEVLQACIVFLYRKREPLSENKVRIIEIAERKDIGNATIALSVPKTRVYQPQQYNECLLCSSKEQIYSIWDKLNKNTKPLPYFGFSFTTGKIQWDLFKNYLTALPIKNSVRLIWAENIQRYCFKNSEMRVGKEYLTRSQIPPNITSETIITQRTTADEQEWRIIATKFSPKEAGFYAFSENHTNFMTGNLGKLNINYVLACLNSKLYDVIFRHMNSNTQVSSSQLNAMPFLDLSKNKQQTFIDLVEHILNITKDEGYLSDSSKKIKVKELESQIDQLVYELYGLTPEEIALVEGFTESKGI